MEEWLDKQEAHHRKSEVITERVFADAMKQVKTMLITKGWEETKKYISDMHYKCKDSNMVGPHALAGAYHKIMQKMQSLDFKESRNKL